MIQYIYVYCQWQWKWVVAVNGKTKMVITSPLRLGSAQPSSRVYNKKECATAIGFPPPPSRSMSWQSVVNMFNRKPLCKHCSRCALVHWFSKWLSAVNLNEPVHAPLTLESGSNSEAKPKPDERYDSLYYYWLCTTARISSYCFVLRSRHEHSEYT